jgi:hypothetical protein
LHNCQDADLPATTWTRHLRQLTATTAQMLNIERVSLWGLTAQREHLECIDLYELSRERHSSGLRLPAAAYPEYFRALAAG